MKCESDNEDNALGLPPDSGRDYTSAMESKWLKRSDHSEFEDLEDSGSQSAASSDTPMPPFDETANFIQIASPRGSVPPAWLYRSSPSPSDATHEYERDDVSEVSGEGMSSPRRESNDDDVNASDIHVSPQSERTREKLLYDVDLYDELPMAAQVTEELPVSGSVAEIRSEFATILDQDFYSSRSFFSFDTLSLEQAQNPCLNIGGLGPVGLPLNGREARAIQDFSTAVSTNSDMWEVPAKKVKFDNPEWETWIKSTVGPKVLDTLYGKKYRGPVLRLKNLTLQEAGSTTRPTEQADDTRRIGGISVVLPSSFQGGQHELQHDGEIKTLSMANSTGLATHIVGTFSGVSHSISPISSGCQLSVEYDIILPNHLRRTKPVLPNTQSCAQKLRNVLRVWTEATSPDRPPFLAILLKDKYPQTPNFGAQSVTGPDAVFMSHIRPLSRELKFRLYLAQVAQKFFWSGLLRRRYWSKDDPYGDDEIDQSRYETETDWRGPVNIEAVFKMDGMPVILQDFTLKSRDLLNGSMRDHDPSKKTVDKDDDWLQIASVEKIYSRTVLIIWPEGSLDSAVRSGNIVHYVRNILQSSSSLSPSTSEQKLVENLILAIKESQQCRGRAKEAFQLLREISTRWNDVHLLLQAYTACQVDTNINLLGVDGFVATYHAFPWDELKCFFEATVSNDVTNSRRKALLEALTSVAQDFSDTRLEAWCAEQSQNILRTLRNPVNTGEIEWILRLSIAHGPRFLRDVIFPQFEQHSLSKQFWLAIIHYLEEHGRGFPPDLQEDLIGFALPQTVGALKVFATKTSTGSEPTPVEPDTESVMEIIKLCTKFNKTGLCSEIFTRMNAASRAAALPIPPPWAHYEELAGALNSFLDSPEGAGLSAEHFEAFFADAMEIILDSPLTGKHLSNIIGITMRRSGCDTTFLRNKLNVQHRKSDGTAALQDLCRFIADKLKPPPGAPDMPDYTHLISDLADAAIDTFPTESLHRCGPSHLYHGKPVLDPIEHAMDLMKFCFAVGFGSKCERVLARLLPPPIGFPIEQHLECFHLKFLPIFDRFLDDHAGCRSAKIEQCFAQVVMDFAETFMDDKKPDEPVPAAELQNTGCGRETCMDCKELRAFFLSDQRTLVYSRNAAARAHLESELAKTAAWGVVCHTNKRGPKTLKVTKPAKLGKIGLWAAANKKANTLRQLLGNSESQKRILGDDYEWVFTRITGERITGEGALKRPKKEEDDDDIEIVAGPSQKRPRMS
ncbi:hypothetical protein DFH06DRAFT_1469912 [Mycena polygramma]|nr:hypothetical protein DFH06DRAFT_1469912 [Mycena polygramma]